MLNENDNTLTLSMLHCFEHARHPWPSRGSSMMGIQNKLNTRTLLQCIHELCSHTMFPKRKQMTGQTCGHAHAHT